MILRSAPGTTKRIQQLEHSSRESDSSDLYEPHYTVIFGSHQNSCLKIERNSQECFRVGFFTLPSFMLMTRSKPHATCICCYDGEESACKLRRLLLRVSAGPVSHLVGSVTSLQTKLSAAQQNAEVRWALVQWDNAARVNANKFTPCWISFDRGKFSMGAGIPGSGTAYTWEDPMPIEDVKHVGLGSWNTYVCFKNIKLQPLYGPSRRPCQVLSVASHLLLLFCCGLSMHYSCALILALPSISNILPS